MSSPSTRHGATGSDAGTIAASQAPLGRSEIQTVSGMIKRQADALTGVITGGADDQAAARGQQFECVKPAELIESHQEFEYVIRPQRIRIAEVTDRHWLISVRPPGRLA